MDRHRRTDRRAGRAAARPEHRHGGARHGQFRSLSSAAGQSARRLAQRPCTTCGCGGRFNSRRSDAVRLARCRGGRLQFRSRRHGARPRSGQAGDRARGGGASDAAADRGGRNGRGGVRSRALGASERGSRPCRSHRDLSGQPGLRLAQSGAGGTGDRLRVVQADDRRRIAVHYAGAVGTGAETTAVRLLRRSRARARPGGVFPPAGKTRHHVHQSAQYLHAHAADATGHSNLARRRAGDRRGAQGAGARRRSRRRGGGEIACAHRRARRRPRAVRARTGARTVTPPAPQSDRRRAPAVGRIGQGPALRRPWLQASGADRAAHRRPRVVSIARGDRHRPRSGERSGGEGACRQAARGSPNATIACSPCARRRSKRTSQRCSMPLPR